MSISPLVEIDDRALARLAVEPPRPLLPVLRQAKAMVPLVVVLAFIPTLYAITGRTLSDQGARQGLLSLRCMTAGTFNEFIDPGVDESPLPSAYQPALMTWLTALMLRLFGSDSVAGLVAGAYLCTGGIVIATYVIARRLGGEALGLCSALLVAFNPYVLRLAQEPVPQSAATLFAILAIAGTVAHWQKSPAVASVQLLLGGVSLALCLLAGGPVAPVVVLMLMVYASLWKLDVWRSQTPDAAPDRNPISRKQAVRSIVILALTGFAGGGWRPLLLGSRYGFDFWHEWLGWGGDQPAAAAGSVGLGQFLLELNQLVLPLGILSVVGIGLIIAEIIQRSEGPGRHHRGLVLVWVALSAILWWLSGAGLEEGGYSAECWKLLLAIGLAITAAITVLAIIERRIPFRVSVLLAIVTLLALSMGARWNAAHEAVLEAGPARDGLATASIAVVMALLLGAALVVIGQGRPSDAFQRKLLGLLLLGLVVANSARGAVECRRTTAADRELDEIRGVYARLGDVTQLLLVNVTAAGSTERPPLQLVYTLRSLWPRASMAWLNSWDVLPAHLVSDDIEGLERHVVVAWSARQRGKAPVPATQLQALAPPMAYADYDVWAYQPRSRAP